MNVRCLPAALVAVVIWCHGAPSLAQKAKPAENKTSQVRVTLTNTGIRVSPRVPRSGATDFIIVNKSSTRRGLVVNGTDPGGSNGFRYSPLIRSGQSLKMNTWLYPGRSYHLKDYTNAGVIGTEKKFTSHHRTIVRLPSRGGLEKRPVVKPNKAYVTLSDKDIKVGSVPTGYTKLVIENKSVKPKGVYISGKDAGGSPMLRHTRLIQPGESAVMSVWLYEDRGYAVRDYTSCVVEPGKGPQFTSEFSKDIRTEKR